MDDLEKQIAYWRDSALEEWEVANELLALGRTRHALFWAHLALEKMLKAHVLQQSKQEPPKIHNLLILAQNSGVTFSKEQRKLLARVDQYQIQGRYGTSPRKYSTSHAKAEMAQAGELIQWLRDQF